MKQPVNCYIQLRRPSDGATSEPLPFEYRPLDSGRRSIWEMRKSWKEKGNLDFFTRLSCINDDAFGSGNIANGHSKPVTITLNNANNDVEEVILLDTPTEPDAGPTAAIASATTTTTMASVIDGKEKAIEWIEKNEFVPINDDGKNVVGGGAETEAPIRTNNDDDDDDLKQLLEQVAELDAIYADQYLKKEVSNLEKELQSLEQAMPRDTSNMSMDLDEAFDDNATYTSLQRAFKNPVSIADPMPPSPPRHFDIFEYDCVEAVPHVSPLSVSPNGYDASPLKRDSPKLEEGKLPPLPPKRSKKSPQSPDNSENHSYILNTESGGESLSASPARQNSTKSLNRPTSQIIIMRTPDQSPLNRRSPASPKSTGSGAGSVGGADSASSTGSLPKQKKSGFFSKLFSRRKSKGDVSSEPNTECRSSPDISREPSINHFDIHDPNRLSTRSIKSLQIPTKKAHGKPVGRSVSSVSGKRPHLTADIIHIPLKGDSSDSLNMRSGSGTLLSLPGNASYGSTVTLSNHLDKKTVSALELADLPIQDGNMELIAIADAQSLRNLCEGEYNIKLDPSVDLTEAEHFALYTSVAPYATQSEFDENSCYYAPMEQGEIMETSEVARRLADLSDPGFEQQGEMND